LSSPENRSARPRPMRSPTIVPASPVEVDRRYFGLCPFPTELEELFDDVARRTTVRFRLESGHDAVPEHRRRDRAYLIEVRDTASLQRRARLRPQHQVLGRARPCDPPL